MRTWGTKESAKKGYMQSFIDTKFEFFPNIWDISA